jgi:hypothetical protein
MPKLDAIEIFSIFVFLYITKKYDFLENAVAYREMFLSKKIYSVYTKITMIWSEQRLMPVVVKHTVPIDGVCKV